MSVKLALEKYSRRAAGVKRKRQSNQGNASPEKEVEKEVLEWARKADFDLSVVESKATYSLSAGRYLHGNAEAGFPDLVGNTPMCHGSIACFIELKAKGKINTIRPGQVEFLSRKIKRGCFAVCVDSAESLANHYRHWHNLLLESQVLAIDYLLSVLPKYKDDSNELLW